MNARPIAADDFAGIARQHRIPAPNPIRAADEEWAGFCRRVWSAFPAWGFDRGYVAELARENLPRVLAQIGLGQMLGRIHPEAKHIAPIGPNLLGVMRHPDGRWMMFRLEPDSADILALDELSHAWRCPVLAQRGDDLIDLGAWRWAVTPAKAAFRIARLCGSKRPVP